MARRWQSLCKGKGLRVEGDEIVVTFENEREHRVSVEEEESVYRLTSMVARKVDGSIEDLALRLWAHNRVTQLVGFRTDERQRVIGESWVPKAGLSAEEFVLHVRHVAAQCDRLEYLLTGKDQE